MINLQKAGGYAALFEALAYILGFVAMATLFNPGNTAGWEAAQKLEFVLQRRTLFTAWTLLIYVAFGVALVVLVVALHERLKQASPALTRLATPFGLIWAGLVIASGMVSTVGLDVVADAHSRSAEQAALIWMVTSLLQDSLGGGVEIVGGLWVLLVCAAALTSQQFSRWLGYLGVLAGLAGVLTVIPTLKEFGAVFGLTQIVWFGWLGISMLRSAGPSKPGQALSASGAFGPLGSDLRKELIFRWYLFRIDRFFPLEPQFQLKKRHPILKSEQFIPKSVREIIGLRRKSTALSD